MRKSDVIATVLLTWLLIIVAFLPACGTAPIADQTAVKVESLSRGMSGEAVKFLQVDLKNLGCFKGDTLGNFGEITEAAVKCAQKQAGLSETGIADAATQAAIKTAIEAKPVQALTLSWDNATRKAWTAKWEELISKDLAGYEAAEDTSRICPKFKSLSREQKIKALGEFWVATAYFESGYNPASASVDVGTAGNKDSWSVGLYQLSVRDTPNMAGPRYAYEELKTALPNIHLAHLTMQRQIKNCGKMILPNASKCRYWAVLLDGNKYSKVDKIIERVAKNAQFCR